MVSPNSVLARSAACRRTVTTALLAATVSAGAVLQAMPAVAATPHSPWGRIGAVSTTLGSTTASGIAIDPDTRGPVWVTVSRDGQPIRNVLANQFRDFVGRNHPRFGPYHGWSATFFVPNGQHQVCATAHNVSAGRDQLLGCTMITGQHNPVGSFSFTRTASGVAVTGWAVDPDTNAPIAVEADVDGAAAGQAVAGGAGAVPAAWSSYGNNHGFSTALVTAAGAHTLCLTALNLSYGTNSDLGCQQAGPYVTPPSAPQSLVVTATAQRGVTVQWGAPADNGGGDITGYQVAANSAAPVTAPAGSSNFAVAGLAPGTRYTISVAAVNSAGVGPAATVQATTQGAPAIPPQTTPAPVSTSHYLRTLTGYPAQDVPRMRAMGATDAGYNPSGHRYLVLQDIGGQTGNGVMLSATSKFVSYSALVSALNAYIDGYASTQKANAPMLLAIGTNNDMNVSSATGAAWAVNVVNPVRAYAAKYPNITVAGANDMEPGFTASVQSTRGWLSGYLSATSAQFVFNGSADGCPPYSGNGCNNGWTTADLHWLSGGAAPARTLSLPQIYNSTMPLQWHVISANGAQKLNFAGPLTEWTACDQAGGCSSSTNVSAWTMLFNALNSDPRTAMAAMPYGTDLRID